MNPSVDAAKRDRTFWRGMYLIAFAIGVVVPIASIIAAAGVTDATAWRSADILVPDAEAKTRADVSWRYETVAGSYIHRAYERSYDHGSLLLPGLAWSGATLIGIAGAAGAAWIVIATGEKLAVDQARGYLRGMFFMAFADGALVPIAAIIASGVTSSHVPQQIISNAMSLLLIIMWCGMIAVCITGLFSAAWLVKTAAAKLRPVTAPESVIGPHEPRYFPEIESVRQ